MTDLAALSTALDELRDALVTATAVDERWAQAHPVHRSSAQNLAHHVAWRRRDLRGVQAALRAGGLPPLGGVDAHVLASVDAARHETAHRAGRLPAPRPAPPVGIEAAARLLARNTGSLLGATGGSSATVVTLPATAADDPGRMRRLGGSGATVVRIAGAPARRADEVFAALPFVVEHADAVAVPCVRTAEEVRALQDRLAGLGGAHLGVILEMRAVPEPEELAAILFAALHSRRVGVATGSGTPVPEELRRLCAAAHLPVIRSMPSPGVAAAAASR